MTDEPAAGAYGAGWSPLSSRRLLRSTMNSTTKMVMKAMVLTKAMVSNTRSSPDGCGGDALTSNYIPAAAAAPGACCRVPPRRPRMKADIATAPAAKMVSPITRSQRKVVMTSVCMNSGLRAYQ